MKTWITKHIWVLSFGFLAVFGTLFGAVSFFVRQQNAQLEQRGIKTQGIVTDLVYSRKSRAAAPVVEFDTEWEGRRTWVSNTFANPPSHQIGDSVSLWYDAKNPDQVMLSGADQWLLPTVFGSFALIFGGIGYGGLLWRFFKNRRRAWIFEKGRPVEAAFVGVVRKTSIRVGGSSPFVVQCQWHDRQSSRVFVFESDPVWFNPENFIPRDSIRVLVDPADPKSYWVDLSFLPEPGN